MKSRSSYICQQCGYKSPSFLGKCPECESWNSLVETVERIAGSPSWGNKKRERSNTPVSVQSLSDVLLKKVKRFSTGIKELDQVLGGGLVPGSVVLLSGDPGIGKSTLTLQILSSLGGLYVTGEESSEQVKLRAERLGVKTDNIFIFAESQLEEILIAGSDKVKDIQVLIVDSIQTIWSEELSGSPGSVGQVRESTLQLLNFAKTNHIPVLIIGHVTKDGTIAGPKILEHIVDTVLYLEGERYQTLRLLRATKNRFGPVDEVGVFSMEEKGMVEVLNPSELFLGESTKAPGSIVVATLEGSRPLLVEVQALTVSTNMPVPRRVGNGVNSSRLQMLVAIVQKHLRMPLGQFDIYINVASGIRVFEPAADLAICLAIVSSFKNKPISPKTVAIGEVGLLGEIRNVIGIDRRVKESKKLGYSNILSPREYRTLPALVSALF